MKVAKIAALVQDGAKTFLMLLTEDDTDCERFEVNEAQVRKLVSEGFNIAMRK
jgi:hypothetical protein